MADIDLNNLRCIRCGEVLETRYEDDELYPDMICPKCGHVHLFQIPDEEYRNEYHYFNEEVEGVKDEFHGYYGKCPICGNHLIISNNFMRSEVLGDVEGPEDENGLLEDDTMTEEVMCPNCGTSVSLIPPKPSEYNNFPLYSVEDA